MPEFRGNPMLTVPTLEWRLLPEVFEVEVRRFPEEFTGCYFTWADHSAVVGLNVIRCVGVSLIVTGFSLNFLSIIEYIIKQINLKAMQIRITGRTGHFFAYLIRP